MEEDISKIIDESRQQMDKAIEHLEHEFLKIRTGRANPMMLEGLKVEYYGTPTPINQVANVTVGDARTLQVQPYEKSLISAIEKVIIDSNLGINPQNDGTIIRLPLPILTEERRKQLVKQSKELAEQARVSIRNIRRDANDTLKKMTKKGLSEDEAKAREQQIQKLTDENIASIDQLLSQKEEDIMTV